MFTKLFRAAQAAKIIHNNVTFSGYEFKNAAGSIQKITTTAHLAKYCAKNTTDTGLSQFTKIAKGQTTATMGLMFGNGDTPATSDDYQLAGDHFTNYNGTYTVQCSEDMSSVTYTYTLTNTGDSAFTVKEIGLFAYTSKSADFALLMREVLDNPVTIEPAGVGQVVLTINTGFTA